MLIVWLFLIAIELVGMAVVLLSGDVVPLRNILSSVIDKSTAIACAAVWFAPARYWGAE